MKLCRPVILAFVLVTTVAPAAFAGEVSFGAKAGLAVSNITETPEEWEDAKSFTTGFCGGVFLNYAMSGSFSLQPELLYVPKGVEGSIYEDVVDVSVTGSFDYVELPVLAKYSFLEGKAFRPNVYAGPSVAFCTATELEITAWIVSASVDVGSLAHTTDFGLVLGGGFDYAVGGGVLTFDARYERDFTNVVTSGDFEINGSTQTITVDDFKNYSFIFMVGYLF